MTREEHIEAAIQAYHDKTFEYEQFLSSVQTFFTKHPVLNQKSSPIIHSVIHRLKDTSSLRDKLHRLWNRGEKVSRENLFEKVTDFIGVRVLHLYRDQFPIIHEAIMEKIRSGDWSFVEPPKAMTWDPESASFYKSLNLKTEVRETYYTSIHYVIRQGNGNSTNNIYCEVQVRTLFEEIWGQIDHTINYPHKTDSVACKEQLRVLAKLVSTGTRLADSIFRSYNDHVARQVKEKEMVKSEGRRKGGNVTETILDEIPIEPLEQLDALEPDMEIPVLRRKLR